MRLGEGCAVWEVLAGAEESCWEGWLQPARPRAGLAGL